MKVTPKKRKKKRKRPTPRLLTEQFTATQLFGTNAVPR